MIWAHNDIAREVVVLGAQAVKQPVTDAGTGQGDRTTKRLQRGAGVVDAVAMHRAQDAKLIGMSGHVREQFANRQTRLTVLLKLERRGQHLVATVTEV